MEFSEPLYVSQNLERDALSIELLDPMLNVDPLVEFAQQAADSAE